MSPPPPAESSAGAPAPASEGPTSKAGKPRRANKGPKAAPDTVSDSSRAKSADKAAKSHDKAESAPKADKVRGDAASDKAAKKTKSRTRKTEQSSGTPSRAASGGNPAKGADASKPDANPSQDVNLDRMLYPDLFDKDGNRIVQQPAAKAAVQAATDAPVQVKQRVHTADSPKGASMTKSYGGYFSGNSFHSSPAAATLPRPTFGSGALRSALETIDASPKPAKPVRQQDPRQNAHSAAAGPPPGHIPAVHAPGLQASPQGPVGHTGPAGPYPPPSHHPHPGWMHPGHFNPGGYAPFPGYAAPHGPPHGYAHHPGPAHYPPPYMYPGVAMPYAPQSPQR